MGLKLMAEVGLDGAGFERGLKKMGEEAGRSVKNLAMTAFGVYGLEQAISKTVETATDLVNESKRLDLTVEQLQLLRQAAKDGGTEMETLASAFEKMDIARAKALSGDKTAMAAFTKLGVSQAMLQTQTAASIFMKPLAQSVQKGNVEDLAPALKEILGKGFGQIIPVLKTDFDELGGKMKKLGSIMDAETAVKLKALGDNFDLLKNVLAAQLGPVIISVIESFLMLIGKIKEVGAFLGALSANGIKQGLQSFSYNAISSIIDKIPGKLGETLQKKYDESFKQNTGMDPKQAVNLFMGAGAAGKDQSDEWKATLDEMRKNFSDAAKELEHPKPINTAEDVPAADKAKHAHMSAATDSLVKVGNFLGSNANTISRVDQRKIELLNRIANNTAQKNGGGGSFGMMHGLLISAN